MQFLVVAKYVGVDQPVRLVATLEEARELADVLYDYHPRLVADYPTIVESDAPDYMGIEVLTVDDRGIIGEAVVTQYRALYDGGMPAAREQQAERAEWRQEREILRSVIMMLAGK